MDTLRIKHRLTGAAGSPTGAGFKSGEVAINFGVTGTPEFWSYDGAAWKQLNPASVVTIENVTLAGGTAGSATGIGAAYSAFAPKPTASIVTATFAGTSYIRTGVGTADSDWAAMGAATPFASAAETGTGTDAAKAVSPAGLAGSSLATATGAAGVTNAADAGKWVRLGTDGRIASGFIPDPTKATAAEIVTGTENGKYVTPLNLKGASKADGSGVGGAATAADAGYLVALGAGGKISSNLLPASPILVKGAHDFTVAPPVGFTTGLSAGAFYYASANGVVAAGYTGEAGTAIKSGDMVLWDGAAWHVVPNVTDLNAYLPLAGGTMAGKSSKITWPAATTATPEIYLDLNGGQLDRALIDCGTY
jgi:hypothetical protein